MDNTSTTIFLFQSSLNSTSSELQQLRDMSVHQKKRTTDMLSNLLKDMAEIGAAIGSEAELNVSNNSIYFLLKVILKMC
jgi:kinesin family protein 5